MDPSPPSRGNPPFVRHGVAGIIAALMLFTMLFTVGTGYFMFQENLQMVQIQAQAQRVNYDLERLNERLAVKVSLLPSQHLSVTVNDTGGYPSGISWVLIRSDSGISSAQLQLYLNPQSSRTFDSNFTYAGRPVLVKLLTFNGGVFAGSYP